MAKAMVRLFRDNLTGRRRRRTLSLSRLLLRRLLLGLGPVVPNDASGGRAGDGMMAGNMPRNSTHRRAFHAPLRRRHSGAYDKINGQQQHTRDE